MTHHDFLPSCNNSTVASRQLGVWTGLAVILILGPFVAELFSIVNQGVVPQRICEAFRGSKHLVSLDQKEPTAEKVLFAPCTEQPMMAITGVDGFRVHLTTQESWGKPDCSVGACLRTACVRLSCFGTLSLPCSGSPSLISLRQLLRP